MTPPSLNRLFLFLLLSLSAANAAAQTVITPCGQFNPIHVVVLGSSTAAGAGSSPADSSWVNRYRDYLQALNPLNQVTNLGVGGTTTYQIMPDWFIPPAGRPFPTPAKNVTQAITLNADAIIVNMPSNDAANNYATSEQLFNFATIVAEADSAGIPVWVCTTQPRNNFSAAQILTQTQVRDSVLATYAPFALNFWSGAATMSNTLNPIYDSGDGVHLNNAGHNLLFQEAVQAAIPNVLADTLPSPEFVLGDVFVENPSACGDSNTLIRAIVANLGTTGPAVNTINFAVTNTLSNTTTNTTVSTATALGTCAADTLTLAVNTYQPSALLVEAFLNSLDLNMANDTAQAFGIRTTGHPTLTGLTDSVCAGEPALLSANGSLPTDNVLWYDSPAGGNILASGNNLPVNPPYQTRYPEAVRGNLWFDNSLPTLKNTNINWNGVTFDIVASDTVTIDSLSLKINSTGNQAVIAYYRMGSEQGQAMNPAAWTSWGVLNLQVSNAGDFKILDLPDMVLPAGDTLGVYIHMQIPNSTLAYRSTGSPASFQNGELQILSGSGVAYTFGSVFTPRIWSGEVFYHHGFNPLGDCQSPRMPLTPEVFEPVVDLGNDTAICEGQNLLLDAGNFTSYYWNTHDVAANLTVSTAGIYDVVVTDERGCQGADTIAVDVWPLPGVDLGQDTTICEGNSIQLAGGTFASYLWNNGETTPAIVTSDSGTYRLLVTDANGCQNADSIVVSVGICVGLDEQDRETAMVLYPNPTSGNFSVRIPSQEQLRTLRIMDLQGHVVYQHKGLAHPAGFSPNLPAGSYLVEIKTTQSQAVIRLLAQ